MKMVKYPKWRFYQKQRYRRRMKGKYPHAKDDKVFYIITIGVVTISLAVLLLSIVI